MHAERIRKLFGQWIKAGHRTRFFDSFPAEFQARLADAAGLVAEERPLVACYFSEEAWTLLTGQRLIWHRAGRQCALAWEELVDVQVVEHTARPRNAFNEGTTSPLQVVTRDGHAYVLELEAGEPFFGFWTAMQMIVRAQRRGSMGSSG